jgi:putative heme iron utilization protein
LISCCKCRRQCATIRLKLLKIRLRLTITARRVRLGFSESYLDARDFAQILVHLHNQPLWKVSG